MKAILFTLPLLTALAFSASSQTISTSKPAPATHPPAFARAYQPVTLSWAQVVAGVHRVDSLRQLATRRQLQASASARAAAGFRRACDSLRTANDYQQQELASVKSALVNTNVLLVSQAAKTDKYRARAHRKGWLNAVLVAGVAGLGYALVAR